MRLRSVPKVLCVAVFILGVSILGTTGMASAGQGDLPPCTPANDGQIISDPDVPGVNLKCDGSTGRWLVTVDGVVGAATWVYSSIFIRVGLSYRINAAGKAAVATTSQTSAGAPWYRPPGSILAGLQTQKLNSTWTVCRDYPYSVNQSTASSRYIAKPVGNCGSGYYRLLADGWVRNDAGNWYGGVRTTSSVYVTNPFG